MIKYVKAVNYRRLENESNGIRAATGVMHESVPMTGKRGLCCQQFRRCLVPPSTSPVLLDVLWPIS